MRKAAVILLSILFALCFTSCKDLLKIPDVSEPISGSSETVSISSAKTKVIVLSGQSNAAGVSYVETLSAEDQTKYAAGFESILIRVTNAVSENNINTFVKVTTGWGDNKERAWFGPEVGLAEQLASDYPGENIYIIKYAWSGAPLEGYFTPGNLCWNQLCSAIDEGLSELKSQSLDPEIVAFCWMQGESDACVRSNTEHYYSNQKIFVESLREKYGDFFFLDAGISNSWKFYTAVNTYKRDMDNDVARCVFINSNYYGLKVSDFDIAHYDASSMLRLGHLFGEQVSAHIVTE